MWHLVIRGKLSLADVDRVSIVDVDCASRALEEWDRADRELSRRAAESAKGGAR